MDEWLQVPAVEYAFVISDCVGFVESVGKPPLISLDQVAKREGQYLTYIVNRHER